MPDGLALLALSFVCSCLTSSECVWSTQQSQCCCARACANSVYQLLKGLAILVPLHAWHTSSMQHRPCASGRGVRHQPDGGPVAGGAHCGAHWHRRAARHRRVHRRHGAACQRQWQHRIAARVLSAATSDLKCADAHLAVRCPATPHCWPLLRCSVRASSSACNTCTGSLSRSRRPSGRRATGLSRRCTPRGSCGRPSGRAGTGTPRRSWTARCGQTGHAVDRRQGEVDGALPADWPRNRPPTRRSD